MSHNATSHMPENANRLRLDQANTAYIPHITFRASSSEGSAVIGDDERHYSFRPPRHNHISSSPTDDRSRTTMHSIPSSSSSSTPSLDVNQESQSPNTEPPDTEMDLETDKPSEVDYSVRESDQYYCHTAARTIFMGSSDPKQHNTARSTESGASLSRWMHRKWKNEKRFEVVRSRPPFG